jgi:hypothetical protein
VVGGKDRRESGGDDGAEWVVGRDRREVGGMRRSVGKGEDRWEDGGSTKSRGIVATLLIQLQLTIKHS